MPNITINLYLNDKDYSEYIKKKKELNEEARELIRRKIRKIKNE